MDIKLAFWTFALALMATMVLMGLNGWRQIRRGEVEKHRRSMHWAIGLFFSFIVAYLFKLRFIGREVFAEWSSTDVTILRIHESFVLVLFIAGVVARLAARRVQQPGPDRRRLARRHRLAGRTALIAGVFALVTAALVLSGMYRRAQQGATIQAHMSHTAGSQETASQTISVTISKLSPAHRR